MRGKGRFRDERLHFKSSFFFIPLATTMIASSQRLSLLLLSVLVLLGIYSYYYHSEDILNGNFTRPFHGGWFGSEPAEELAYVTFFTGTEANKSDPDIDNDVYFVATRILGYQLMHSPKTRTQRNIPFVILVPPDVVPAKRDRFERDGAIVIEVPYLEVPEWVVPELARWKDVMSKMRAWQLTQYTRCVLLDGDMVLNAPLDGVFDDPAAQFISTYPSTSEDVLLPERYLFASVPEADPHHSENGEFKDINYFNAGFFVFGPSIPVFDYYNIMLHEEGTWDPRYPEQNLLNYIHRQDGQMPWQRVSLHWNVKFPTMKDKEEGTASMHDKFWQADIDGSLQPYYNDLRSHMEGFYEGMESS